MELSFCVDLHTRKNNEIFLSQEHIHGHHELYFLISGQTKYFINNQILYVHPGEATFIKNGYIHKTAYETSNDSKRILVSFTTDFLGDEYASFFDELGEKKIFTKNEEVYRLFTRLYNEYTEKKPHYVEQCRNLLKTLLIILSREDTPAETKKLSVNEAIIQSATKYITENLSEDITLNALADTYAMSVSHFSRTFKLYTGLGISKYIKLLRLLHAEKLLSEKKYSVTDIALLCGFNNSNYFISEFKKYKGETPLSFRKHIK